MAVPSATFATCTLTKKVQLAPAGRDVANFHLMTWPVLRLQSEEVQGGFGLGMPCPLGVRSPTTGLQSEIGVGKGGQNMTSGPRKSRMPAPDGLGRWPGLITATQY